MEYVQVVLFQIPAQRTGEAASVDDLLQGLDKHREHLEAQPGFRDMRIVRSPNVEGVAQVVVETHWADEESLVEYETKEPNVASIVGRHQDLIIADSLQVYDMEALRAEVHPEPTPRATSERLLLPLTLPIAIFLFAVLVVYGLSRIYLEIRPVEIADLSVATPLALAVSAAILLVSWFLAARPSIRRWQVLGIAGIALAALLGGSIFAAVQEEEAEAAEAVAPRAEAAPGPGAPAGAASGALDVGMGDNFFLFGGKRRPNIQVTAGQQVTVNVVNNGKAIHNMRIAGIDKRYDTGDDFVSNPDIMRPGAKATLTFKIDQPGNYVFRCDFHPVEMVGTITVK